MPSWWWWLSEAAAAAAAAAAGKLSWEEDVCAATGVGPRAAVAELGDTTFVFPLCFLCIFWVLALMGDDDDAMSSVMVVWSGGPQCDAARV